MPPKARKVPTMKRQERAEMLSKKKGVHFSKQECERLLQLYKEFTNKPETKTFKGRSGIDRHKFRDILHQYFQMTDDVLMDKIFRAFDADNDSFINEDEWVMGMATFLKGSIEEQARFCFCVYCQRGDEGHITREEMYILLKQSLVHASVDEEVEDSLKDLVEIALKKMDGDHDGRLSLEDYVGAIKSDSLLMEVLGPCLPKTSCARCFLELIQDDKHGKHF